MTHSLDLSSGVSKRRFSDIRPKRRVVAPPAKNAETPHRSPIRNVSAGDKAVPPRISPAVPSKSESPEQAVISDSNEAESETLLESTSESPLDPPAPPPRFSPRRDRLASWWFSFASSLSGFSRIFGNRRLAVSIAFTIFLFLTAWFGASIIRKGFAFKQRVLGVSAEGYASLSAAVDAAKSRDFVASSVSFAEASASFGSASELFGEWNATLVDMTRYVPGLSAMSSGKHLVEAAKDIAEAGEPLSRVGTVISTVGNPLEAGKDVSFLDLLQSMRSNLEKAGTLLSGAESHLELVAVDDLPEDKRAKFVELSTRLPEVVSSIRLFLDHGDILSDMLGEQGPRKFLFLFQNNHELRATGGFIGSYAFLDIADGRVRQFFIDGIFNPDGQLREDVVPPEPLQKVSAGWSLHDSNWFPDFSVSAEKAILFYEKTGGPTVDGVVAFTPDILRKFLAISGPVRMEKYGVTVDEKNFLETIQHQVEVAYDRTENRPKQILADLAPILLERIFGLGSSAESLAGALSAIEDGFSEKQILLYSRNREMQKLVSRAGWSGEILPARRDFVSVVHTNVNGFKTDGVIDETIEHRAEIRADGSVVDTVRVRRTHRGGKTGYEWWDRVNADYLRVYVPLESTLLSASGYTKETVVPPLDYDALGFSRDSDVERERRSTRIDPVSGTRISEDAGKTVFGNWVYVSPGETVEVSYSYLLPFRVDPSDDDSGLASYSLVAEKQSGSEGSAFRSEVIVPKGLSTVWQTPQSLLPFDGGFRLESDLRTDRFLGALFLKK